MLPEGKTYYRIFTPSQIILTMRENEDVWIRSQMNQMRAATTPIIRLMTFLSPTYRRMDAYGKRMSESHD